jgi:alpha/beta superfamily hydrolase
MHSAFNNFNPKIHQIPMKTHVTIQGDRGSLEGIYGIGSDDIAAPTILLFHPQSNANGTMYNDVLQAVFDLFVSMGFIALTINFGGVGNSAGTIENGFGEFLDGASAFKWLISQRQFTKHRWVFGFSFGAYIAAHLTMRRPEVDNFIFLSTPLPLYDFSFFSPCPVPGLFIHAKDDKITPEDQIFEFFLKNDKCKNVSYFSDEKSENSNHFFKNIDQKTSLLLPIYKYIKEKMNWDGLKLIKEYENLLDSINFLEYEDFAKILNKDLSEVIFEDSEILEDEI